MHGMPIFTLPLFSAIPDSENMLVKNSCFKEFLTHCQKQNAVFHFSSTGLAY